MPRLLMFLPLVLFGALGVFLWKGLSLDPKVLPSALIGKPMPAFELPSLHEPIRLLSAEDMQGRPALVNVWATWCPTCRVEMPELMRIAQEEGIPIFGIDYKDDRAAAQAWLKQFGNPFQFNVFDQHGKLGLDLGVYGAPETYLLDANGIVRYRHAGAVTPAIWAEMKALIQTF